MKTHNAMKLWIVCLGALLLLWGVTGCSTEKAVVQDNPPSSEASTSIVGPAGPQGPIGPAGAQGVVGYTGAQGATTVGVAGSTGSAGYAGPQGPVGQTGARGPAGKIDRWISYRTFWFEYNTVGLRDSDSGQVSEIAHYMQQNPSVNVGIDGSIPRGSNVRNQDMADRRVKSVH